MIMTPKWPKFEISSFIQIDKLSQLEGLTDWWRQKDHMSLACGQENKGCNIYSLPTF